MNQIEKIYYTIDVVIVIVIDVFVSVFHILNDNIIFLLLHTQMKQSSYDHNKREEGKGNEPRASFAL